MEILKSALEKVDRPGVVCTYGTVPFILPGLKVKVNDNESVDIGLPLQKGQAKTLGELASPAPFGKGMETVVDLEVRNVLELDPINVVFENPEWEKMVNTITANVRKALGVTHKVSHHFYKLLLYKQGSFFLPHKDTEKEDRMFATLTITLPSLHQGGDLVITHAGETFSFSFDSKEHLFNIQYAAFYADCMHEVKPVAEGYRLTLIYNLTYSKGDINLKAPDNHQYLPAFIKGFEELRNETKNKFIIPLEHEYTEKNLSFQNLKNLDHAKAELLIKAASEAGFMIFLAFINHWESGTPVDDHYGYDDYGDGDHDSSSSYEMEEVYDEYTYIEYWISVDGNKMAFGEFPLSDNEFILPFSFHDDEPFSQDYEDYAGNYGPTLDQLYRRAAIIIWPKEQHFTILAEKGPVAATSSLREYFDRYTANYDEESLEECRQFSVIIMNHWGQQMSDAESIKAHKVMLEILVELGESALTSQFIEKVMFHKVAGDEGVSLNIAGTRLGWNTLAVLCRVPRHLPNYQGEALSNILNALCTGERTPEKEQFCYDFFLEVSAHIVNRTAEKNHMDYHLDNDMSNRKSTLTMILMAASWIGDAALLADPIFDYVLKEEDVWSFDDVVLPVLLNTISEKQATITNVIIQDFSNRTKDVLNHYLSTPLQEPTDWTQNVKLPGTSEDCKELQDFVLHPEEKVKRFRVNKERRQYLHELINEYGLDMTHETERKGSPYTLVCIKTRRTWENQKKQRKYREDCYRQLNFYNITPSSS